MTKSDPKIMLSLQDEHCVRMTAEPSDDYRIVILGSEGGDDQ